MKRIIWSLFAMVLIALPLGAEERHESYFTYTDGIVTVVQTEDGREIEARANLPLFPGDEVRSDRRGRSEVRLADGNVMGIDRNTTVRMQAVTGSYEEDGEQTVAELVFGQVMINRLTDRTVVRVDSRLATYVATSDALFSVESDGRGRDTLSVYGGTVEARTPRGSSRVRAAEQVQVGADGIYGSVALADAGTSEFERWFLKRADRYTRGGGRYLDSSLAYAEGDLDDYGSWVYVPTYARHVWRPYVSSGWRPYYNGYWHHGRSGSLVWVSNEPWGWVPYHYGRWSYAPGYGWVWLPGYGYSPAWVYWMYGPSYIGWIPAGWYDCYGPYYSWLYNPYPNYQAPHFQRSFGAGFYGRVMLRDVDLNGWTFVSSGHLVSRRVDQAALTTDAIRGRLGRDGAYATVSNSPARFGRSDLKDPSTAIGVIARRGAGGGTGAEGSAAVADVTPFIRRDAELSTSIRDRVTRGREPADGSGSPARAGAVRKLPEAPSSQSGTVGSIGRDAGRRDGGAAAGGITRGRETPGTSEGGIRRNPSAGSPERGTIGRSPNAGSPSPDQGTVRRPNTREIDTPSDWRSRVVPRPSTSPAPVQRERVTPEPSAPNRVAPVRPEGDWRSRVVTRERSAAAPSASESSRAVAPAPRRSGDDWRSRGSVTRESGNAKPAPRSDGSVRRGSDVPRRVIDGIGGARVAPSNPSPSRGTVRATPERSAPRPSPSAGSGSSPAPRPSGGSVSSGSSSSSRSSSPPPSSGSTPRSNDSDGGGSVRRH